MKILAGAVMNASRMPAAAGLIYAACQVPTRMHSRFSARQGGGQPAGLAQGQGVGSCGLRLCFPFKPSAHLHTRLHNDDRKRASHGANAGRAYGKTAYSSAPARSAPANRLRRSNVLPVGTSHGVELSLPAVGCRAAHLRVVRQYLKVV